MSFPEKFYLSSSENEVFKEMKTCQVKRRLIGKETELTFLWVTITPSVIGQPYGLGERNIEEVLLAPRYKGYYFENNSKFPIYVYILLPNKGINIDNIESISRDEYIIFAWGEISNKPFK